jgi:hypothetical protein
MNESDFDDFCAVLDGVCTLLSRGAYQPNAASSALFFRSMQAYPLSAFRKALDAHMADPQRGRFVPVPADLIAQIDGAAADDGRPGAEEAWAIAVRSTDESATIVWTEEIAQAWGVCSTVMQLGDEVGARMAFKEAYNRMVTDARRIQKPARWTPTLGHDVNQRREALARAETAGLLPCGEALRLAPPTAVPNGALPLLLASSVQHQVAKGDEAISDPKEIKRRAALLKARLVKPGQDMDSAVSTRVAIEKQKEIVAKQVREYEERHGTQRLAVDKTADRDEAA